MFLMSLGLRLPDREFVHGLLMMRDSKMSKSKGNVVDPYPLVERYGVDAVRYYLAREVIFGQNGSFSPEQFVERVNMDLANAFGNLLNRTIGMMNKYFGGEIPQYKGNVTAFDSELSALAKAVVSKYETCMDDLRITEALIAVDELVTRGNKYIDETMPWVLAKDETKREELASVMSHLANVIYTAAILYKPVLVTASDKALDQLNVPNELRSYENIYNFGVLGGQSVNKAEALFPRLDLVKEAEYIKELMEGKK
jgi:methionyl-tRNA synthetase